MQSPSAPPRPFTPHPVKPAVPRLRSTAIRRNAGFGLGFLLAASSLALPAQSTSTDPTCRDSVFSRCVDPADQNQTQNPVISPRTDQRQGTLEDSTNPQSSDGHLQDRNQLYVDRAGTTSRRPSDAQQNSSQRQDDLFAPDPIVDLQRLARSSTGEFLPIFGRDLFQRAPSTFAPADQIPSLADYIVGPGDDILLRLWGPDSFNSQLTVDSSGAIYLPKVGAIHVAGLRVDQLQQHISSELSHTFRNFNLSVNLGHLRSIQVYVVGEARRPGAYTVSSLSTVLNALFVSGGPNVQGSLRHIQIRREGQPAATFDLYDLVLRGDKSKDIRLQAGDTIFIPAAGPQVALAGSVRHPAIYELAGDTTLQNLLDLAGGFSPTASTTQVSVDRIDANHIRKALNVALDAPGLAMPLRDGDVLYVNHIASGYAQSVTIRGNLANPGRFPFHPGMHLSEIIPDRASLLTNNYWIERNRLGVPVPLFQPLDPADPYNRRSYDATRPNDERVTTLGANGQPTFTRSGSDDPNAQNSRASSQSTIQSAETTLTRGSLAEQQQAAPDRSIANRGERIDITIPAPEIDWSYAVVERLDPDTLKSSLLPFNLGKLLMDHDPAQDIELHAGDVVTILSQADVRVAQDERTKYVRLEGEFASSGVYSVHPNETLDQVVRRAGGLTTRAYLFGGSFTRETARIAQQQRLDEYVNALSIDMQRAAAVRTASSTIGIADPNAIEQQRSIIAQLRQLRATGRVVLEFRPESAGAASIPAISLEDGDTFRVPSTPLTVNVIGAVYGQNVFLYNGERRVKDYLRLAGDPNRVADRKHAFIIRADGSVFSRERAQGVWTNTFLNSRINPGDSIVIPEKLIKPSALRQFTDYSQIISSFALGAAAINVVR